MKGYDDIYIKILARIEINELRIVTLRKITGSIGIEEIECFSDLLLLLLGETLGSAFVLVTARRANAFAEIRLQS